MCSCCRLGQHFPKKFALYEKGSDGRPVIVPEQAEIVRFIYDRYLAGDTTREIKAALEAQGAPTVSGKGVWMTSHSSATKVIDTGLWDTVPVRVASVCSGPFHTSSPTGAAIPVKSRKKQKLGDNSGPEWTMTRMGHFERKK